MARRSGRRQFGSVRKLPSGRYQARYTGPDGLRYEARTPQGRPLTFDTITDADAWLSLRHADVLRGAWLPPAEPRPAPTAFCVYADAWLEGRDLEDTTHDHYVQLLRDHLNPTFGSVPVTDITPAAVREWHAKLKEKTGPTQRSHAYSLLRTVLNTAVADDMIPANPCRVRGAGSVKRAKKIRPASLPELETIVKAMPDRLRLLVLLAAWCALRLGELIELRRRDIDVTNGLIRVRRGTTRRKRRVVKTPKSEASSRDVNIPPHLMPMVKEHLRTHVTTDRDTLLFPAASDPKQHLAASTLSRHWYRARKAAGRDDLRFHDLRHTGAVLAAATGATLKELMARLGHSTPGAALLYQHAAAERDKVIAGELSKLATVTPIRRAKKAKKKASRKEGTA